MERRIGYRGHGLVGHNRGPALDPGASWRRYAWGRARAELLGNRLPLEVIRRRVARAKELGLAYPDYASILLGTGRDIVGFLFTCEAIGLRLRRRLEISDPHRRKLAALVRCERMILAPEAEPAAPFTKELESLTGLGFIACTPPAEQAGWAESRRAIRAILTESGLHPATVVMIGTRPAEEDWSEAAALARFLPAARYFEGSAQPD